LLWREPTVGPNERADGSDDPDGRQRNRRVEVVINTCS
jgi:flagellar motor protein MotB